MKKGFTLLIAAALLALCVSGCNNNTETSSDNINSDTVSSVIENSTTEDESENGESLDSSENSVPDDTDINSDTESTPESSGEIGGSTDIPEISQQRENIAATAQSLIGIDYAYSEASPEKGFDNSGLIYYVLRENGYINCPRRMSEQLEMGTKIGYDEVMIGDVVFFCDKDEETGEDNYFGGIYVGDGKVVYSPYPGEKVKYGDFGNSYWKNTFIHGIKIA